MAKKHRLDIPEKMLRWICPELRESQGKTQSSWHDDIHELGWLTEIKEPLTKQEAWEDCKESIKEEIFKSQGWYFYKGWDLCLENQKIWDSPDIGRYVKEPLNFKEWFHSKEVESLAYHFNDRDAAEKICKAWNAALRGFSNKEK